MKEIQATLYKTDGSFLALVLKEDEPLETFQDLVGGLIEIIHIVPLLDEMRGIFDTGNDLIINEEGRLLDLPINPWSQFVGLNSIWEDEEFRGDMILVKGCLP